MADRDPDARPQDDQPVARQERLEPSAPGEMPPAAARTNLWSGAKGAAIAIAASGLLVLGLWVLSRNAPSAAIDPRLQPNPTAAPAPGRIDDQIYITIEADTASPPAGNPDGS